MKAADYIALYLERRQVTHVFELIGGMIAFLLDSLHQQTRIKIVSMHHEQGLGLPPRDTDESRACLAVTRVFFVK